MLVSEKDTINRTKWSGYQSFYGSGYPDSSPDIETQALVSNLLSTDTQTPKCFAIRTFASPDTQVGLGIRSPVTETPVYLN